MPENGDFECTVLNVVASPHPPGTYRSLFEMASQRRSVSFRGDQYGSISSADSRTAELLLGRLVIWTQIDESEPAVVIDQLREVPFVDLEIQIPDNLGFNCRVFLWAFRITDHKLFVETKNEFGKTVSPNSAAKFFSRLFSQTELGEKAPYVDVTVVPEDDSVNRVLEIPSLKKILIHLTRPNPDSIDDDARRVLARMESMGAKSQITQLTALPGETLHLDEDIRTMAEVAASNGFVETRGYDDGEAIKLSTKEYPKIIKKALAGSASRLTALISIARDSMR
jgi:hypothetical protein